MYDGTVLTLVAGVNAVVFSIKHPGHHNASVVTTREERLSARVDYCNTSTPDDISHQFIRAPATHSVHVTSFYSATSPLRHRNRA